MFGGDNCNTVFPVFLEENRFQYDTNASTQLQLFGNLKRKSQVLLLKGRRKVSFLLVHALLGHGLAPIGYHNNPVTDFARLCHIFFDHPIKRNGWMGLFWLGISPWWVNQIAVPDFPTP